jgi:hypothetical protein
VDESDCPPWNVHASPTITYQPKQQNPHLADDEDSEYTSSGFSSDIGVQGTFQSTDRLRIRWAQPSRSIDDGSTNGRPRVGAAKVKGKIDCRVLGRARERSGGREGIAMRLKYEGTCSGVWYPGVAIMTGLDVVLEAKGCDVSWVRRHEDRWRITGLAGWTGYDVGGVQGRVTADADGSPASQRQSLFDQTLSGQPSPSFDIPKTVVSPGTPIARPSNGSASMSRQSSSTVVSLLKVDLPSQNGSECSFDTNPGTPTSEAGMSSVYSTGTESKGRSRASSLSAAEYTPTTSICIHLNLDAILSPSSDPFTFTIEGTILAIPRSPLRSSSVAPEHAGAPEDLSVSIPRFRVLAAEKETFGISVVNTLEPATDNLMISDSPDINATQTKLEASATKELRSGSGRVTVRTPSMPRSLSPFPRTAPERDPAEGTSRGVSPAPNAPRPRTTSNSSLREMVLSSVRPPRTGALMIPHVRATITPFHGDMRAYAVCLRLPAPANVENEWFEFFLARSAGAGAADAALPRVEIVAATLEGVPVQYEAKMVSRSENALDDVALEKVGDTGWLQFFRVHIGAHGGGAVEVTYTVGDGAEKNTRRAGGVEILLPIFDIPFGRIQVDIESGTSLSPCAREAVYIS